MNPLTYEQASALIGVSSRRLRQITREGEGPQQTPDGRFLPADLGKWLRDRHQREFGVATDGVARDLNAERARLARAQAEKAEFESAEIRGELVRADHVEEKWISMIADARAKLLALPTTLAQRVAAPGKTAEALDVAQSVVHEVLRAIAGEDGPARAGGKARARRVGAAAAADGKPVGRRVPGAKPRVQRRARKVGDRKG